MKGKAEKVLGIILALMSLGILTAEVSSRNSDSPEKRSNQQVQLVHTRQPRLAQNYGKLPLSFELNQGQTDARVRFLARGRGYTIFLTDGETVLTLKKSSVVSGQSSVAADSLPPMATGRRAGILKAGQRTTDDGPRTTDSVLRMRLEGGNAQARIVGLDELPGKSNYFIGNDPTDTEQHRGRKRRSSAS